MKKLLIATACAFLLARCANTPKPEAPASEETEETTVTETNAIVGNGSWIKCTVSRTTKVRKNLILKQTSLYIQLQMDILNLKKMVRVFML